LSVNEDEAVQHFIALCADSDRSRLAGDCDAVTGRIANSNYLSAGIANGSNNKGRA